MKFLTLTLAAVLTLAFSFTTTPAEAAPTEQDRCKRLVTKAERNYASCVTGVAARNLRFGQQTGPQPAALSTCDTRRATALDRIGAKFPSLAPGDCGLDTASAAARATAALVLAGLEEPIDNDGSTYCSAEDTTWNGTECVSSVSVPGGDTYCDAESTDWDEVAGACVATVEEERNCWQSAFCWASDDAWGTGLPVSQSGPATQEECQADPDSDDYWSWHYGVMNGGYLCASDSSCVGLMMMALCASS